MKTMLCLAAVLVCLGASAKDAQQSDEEAAETSEQRFAEANRRLVEAEERLAEAAKAVADIAAERAHKWRPKRAFLGVMIAPHEEDGIRVVGVSPDGGAEVAGLEVDDVIVAINEESLLGADLPIKILYDVLDDISPGDSVQLVVLRDGEEHRFDVATTTYVANSGMHWRWQDWLEDFDWPGKGFRWRDRDGWERHIDDRGTGFFVPGRSRVVEVKAGWHGALKLVDIGEDLGDYFGVDAGVLVLDTPAGSELMPGDILKRIAGAAVSSSNDAYGLLGDLEAAAEAEVRRKNRKVMVNVEPRQADIVDRDITIELEDED